ncbi:cell division protein SepF [Myxosarcina sp. GI1]|uniref:cell division protein SepF n=1 Tax=Myxosarcina sp. GI1 TaxID=1541065 RepID=UPI00056D8E52|nr:cell division protein SepF [Myxosarcina sp. GI1]
MGIRGILEDILGIDHGEGTEYQVIDPPYDDEVENTSVFSNSESEHPEVSTSTVSQSSRKFSVGKEGKMNNKVIGMPGIANSNSEVVVIEPQSFEEMPQVIQALRERKSVVLNLNMMNPEQAQRAVDFVAGGTYAMDGHQERVGESIFLFTPSCVKVSSLTGVIHDVHNPETHVRRPAPVPEAWGEASAVAQ